MFQKVVFNAAKGSEGSRVLRLGKRPNLNEGTLRLWWSFVTEESMGVGFCRPILIDRCRSKGKGELAGWRRGWECSAGKLGRLAHWPLAIFLAVERLGPGGLGCSRWPDRSGGL